MAYADPQSTSNPTTGQPILAAWGDIVRDDLEYIARSHPHCHAYNDAAFSVPNNANTAVTLNSERFDVGGCHSTVSNTSRLTVPAGEDGKYIGGAGGSWASNATGVRRLQIAKNGTTVLAGVRFEAATDNTPEFQVIMPLVSLAAGDYIELFAFQNSGGALNLSLSAEYSPLLWFQWVAV